MTKSILLSIVAVSCLLVGIASVSASTTFRRNLSIGAQGPDVRELQVILNKDPLTAVSSTGSGSPGLETAYFGVKTAKAVARFQEKYAKDILTPNNLTSGTGFVGLKTREKLESLINLSISSSNTPQVSVVPAVSPASTAVSPVVIPSVPIPGINTAGSLSSADIQKYLSRGVIPQSLAFDRVFPNDLMIFGLSHNKAKPGDQLQVTGGGFANTMIFHLGPANSVNVQATTADQFSITVPNISFGQYKVWLTDATRTTENATPLFLTIGNITDDRPLIASVSPIQADRNSQIVVTADSLDTTGNTVYSNIGIIRSVSSPDGHSLTFKVSDLPNAAVFFSDTNINQFTVTFSIGTSKGKSLNYGYFHLTK